MRPVFKIGKSERVFVSDLFICNGHWLVTRDALKKSTCPKPLLTFKDFKFGTFYGGSMESDRVPEMAHVIPKRDGYRLLLESVQDFTIAEDDTIKNLMFKPTPWNETDNIKPSDYQGVDEFFVRVDPKYVPVLRLGYAFAKDVLSPVIVLDSRDLNGNLLAVVMPMRS